ncbi:hypothetical protein V6N13_024728 [Hibiscus sabdariffa]|uniref:Uncharacterized protein n=1 Tax=Hibiscus sabdariffa TaxID=183260 RepID=A0ABR2QG93_9ROSI
MRPQPPLSTPELPLPTASTPIPESMGRKIMEGLDIFVNVNIGLENLNELRAYLMELGSKRSSMECDDVLNTQESNTEAKKQRKWKQYDLL